MTFSVAGCWGRRSGLERGLIVGTCFLSLAAIGLLVGLIVVAVRGPEESNVCLTEGCILTAHSLNQNMKPDLDPCNDFYEYACGRFMETAVIPDDKTVKSTFSDIDEMLRDHLRIIVNEPVNASEIKPFRDLKLLNQACLNVDAIEALGVKPVLDRITAMGEWPALMSGTWNSSAWTWEKTIAKMNSYGNEAGYILAFGIGTDFHNSTRRTSFIDQTELGLEYEYILKRDADPFYLAYKSYQVDLVKLFGSPLTHDQIEAQMARALEFEFLLANISLPREERRDANVLNNPMTINELQEKYPYLQWLSYFNSLMPDNTQFTADDVIVNGVPSFFEKLGSLLASTPPEVVANYLMWRFAASNVPYMGQAFRSRQLEYVRVTSGQEKEDSRALTCTNVVFNFYSQALGSLYVRRHFKEEAKENVLEMVSNLKVAFKEILDEIDWMDDKTKEAAHGKADAMKSQMAYADELLDDAKLTEFYKNFNVEIDVANFYDSIVKLRAAIKNYANGKLREAVNNDDWTTFFTPAMVDALYSPQQNIIIFPAAILQGAFFNFDRPHYMNYGGIGFVIGHEITHGFDDQGSRYDATGNLYNWWNNSTRVNFQNRTQCLVEQYSSFTEPQTGLNLSGINTLGENIADNGGIKESYRAYRKLIEKIGEEKLLPGIDLNQRQLFWVSAAQVWCSVQRTEAMRMKIYTDPHSPERFRVTGSLRNRPEFAEDFNCPLSTPMNPQAKCSVW